ncbi:hypothetical protein N665_0027s0007 [Sinapis alba]|nr:hypothetical protein N665_0027s0007 [Sinapis alba]
MGAAWIIRYHNGEVLLHSRRSFAAVLDLNEGTLVALYWTLESLATHHMENLIIAGEDVTLLRVMLRPRAWPSFTSEYHDIKIPLSNISRWKVHVESRSSNIGAFLIAKSVLHMQWGQSYVARDAPCWSAEFLLNEKL